VGQQHLNFLSFTIALLESLWCGMCAFCTAVPSTRICVAVVGRSVVALESGNHGSMPQVTLQTCRRCARAQKQSHPLTRRSSQVRDTRLQRSHSWAPNVLFQGTACSGHYVSPSHPSGHGPAARQDQFPLETRASVGSRLTRPPASPGCRAVLSEYQLMLYDTAVNM